MSEETREIPLIDDGALPADRYIDRELSWLAFNQRVLELAEDETVPLLERANFLAIFAANLDEFFMVRVAGLKRRILTGLAVPTNVGTAPTDVLAEINRRAYELQRRHARCFAEQVKPQLAEAGVHIVEWEALDDADREILTEYYEQRIYPVLMPLAVDPAHPFPYISGRALNLSIRVHNPNTDKVEFARLKVPQMIPRYVRVDRRESDDNVRFIPLEELIANQLDGLFPGMKVIDDHVFRVTRNEDVEIEEDETENLIQALEKELLRRRFGPPIRLEISDDLDEATLELLVREFDIDEEQVYTLPAPLDLSGLFALSGLRRPDLKFKPHIPVTHPAFRTSSTSDKPDMFAAIARREVLVHHPYESFATSVQAFIEQAATDPDVLAIKQTLYRTSGDSPIVAALIKAAEAGKQVLALVEVKARFDEEANITWARKLEQAGVHVVYGIVGLKTHCKLVQVIREESGRLTHYSHIGTGNYNPKTSRIYEDFGLFTTSPDIGRDATKLFNVLSGYAIETDYDRLLVAPLQLRTGLLERIEREAEHARAGRPSGIRLKANSMVDEAIIDALYRASQAGVPVDVWVRGICSIRAGVPGLSENIRVRSVLGRYLEHSRIYWFENAGERDVFIGSADLMHRNLDRRIEVLVSIVERDHLARIDRFFGFAFSDEVSSWRMLPDGTWQRRVVSEEGEPLPDLQDLVMIDRTQARRAR
ncbi:RNA degradosome polyphosphate kinase [Leucobacter aridicollis]|uniref:Polyphosphate kinase n=1 Tax=Leucobacter aridicollis TaxID=283878 RepID=A0A852RMC8_9MICO|nr:RNA degradosome polyphosphate kinase [Leucobacter aridicollis]MBL3681173.1 RNA degradosome polyphosphate kinase [Leucobacter aridicollis]NYD27812.1 polyphosphate kinase [Leucobacter aridicollis]